MAGRRKGAVASPGRRRQEGLVLQDENEVEQKQNRDPGEVQRHFCAWTSEAKLSKVALACEGV